MHDFLGKIKVVSTVRPTYRLQKKVSDGEVFKSLVQDGVQDFQAFVNSNYSNSLDYILDRFLDDDYFSRSFLSDSSSEVANFLVDKLDLASTFVDNMEEVREVYELPDSMSYSDIRSFLESEYKKTLEKVGKFTNEKNEKQSSNENSQQENVVSKKESQTVQEHSKSDSQL